jgi:class 3 adenylate cyclase/tetratricopeptide (TPR) repeat protein
MLCEERLVLTIEDWLASVGLPEYAGRFAENCVDTSVLRDLTDQDLKELGIPLGHRKKMLRAIAELDGAAVTAPSVTDAAAGETAERRQITVMFCDLAGSTELSGRLDPEDLRVVIRSYQSACAQVIASYDGFISRFLGDGILVYFGYPRAHEDDAERAVRAGLDIVAAVGRLKTALPEPLTVRIGVATGIVVVGDLIGEGVAQEQAVTGETPNLAARLQSVAEPGGVVISATTHRLATGHFEYRELPPARLKGFAEPVVAWQVLRASAVESRFEAEHGPSLPPLIGRHEEIELLLRRWRQAVHGEGRVVLLSGEPGIGKSHIALTFQDRLQAEPRFRLRFFCSSHHTNSALFPFVSQLERTAGFERSDTPTQKLTKLESLLAQSNADASQIAILANLLSLPASERYRMPELSPQKRKEQTLSALMARLEALARIKPVLVTFEDVHWIDPTSLELLATTVQRLAQWRVLLLLTARAEFTLPWPSHEHMTTISLTRLSRPHGAALIERVTAGRPLPDQLMEKILAHADGVPLFVEELTKMVLESGLLQERDGQYVLERPLPSFAIPTTLYASLIARLDRLAAVKEVAQIGAAVGREFFYELLNAVTGMPRENLDNALDQLVRSELVFGRGEKPNQVYTFKHVLVRDAAYAGLLKSRRVELHAAIAQALEERFPEIMETEPETLAHHLTEAGLTKKAVEYWLRAGKKAAARSGNLEAVAHLRRGIEAVGRLGQDSERDRLELELQLALAPCLIATQGPAAGPSVETFTRAHALCERLGNLSERLQVMFWLTTASVVRGELPQAEEAIASLLKLAGQQGDQAAMLNAMRGHAMILLFMGRLPEARTAIELAIETFNASKEKERLAARAAGQDAGAAGLALMAWALWVLGNVDQSLARMGAALERADVVGHPHTQAYVAYYASVLHGLRGEPTISQRHAERCLALSEEHGFAQWRSLSLAVRGISMAMLDPSFSTIDEVSGALNAYRRAGYQLGITALDVLLCPALLLLQQPDAALELTDQGLSTAAQNSERIFEGELYRLKARALLLRDGPGAAAAAQALLEQALTTARRQSAHSLGLRAARDLAVLWIEQGKQEQAIQLLAPVLAGLSEGSDTHEIQEARALLERRR